jgi:hypothetical protein
MKFADGVIAYEGEVLTMHPNLEIAALINQQDCLSLYSLHERGPNQLELIISGADIKTPKKWKPEFPVFRLFWNRYAAFLVTEEMVGSCGNGPEELYQGRHLRLYSKSHFLDHLSRDTGAHLKALIHYKIVCLDHLVDVAATSPPVLELIDDKPRT